MKYILTLTVLVSLIIPGVATGQAGNLVFNSNSLDDSYTGDEVDPFIVIDEENNSYGLCFTRLGDSNFPFSPQIKYVTGPYWNIEGINPINSGSPEYLEPRMHYLGGGNRLLSFRYAEDFDFNNYNNSGWWYTYLDPNTGSWQSDSDEGAFAHVSYRDYANSSNEVHILSVWNYSPKKLKYFKRNSNGTYNPNGYEVASSNGIYQGAYFDLTVGDNNTPYFCYRVGDYLKARKYQEDETTISSLYNDYGTWNGKLRKMTPPTIAYNNQSGKVMIVYSDYDSNSGFWSLFYTVWNSGSSNWSSPVKVYSNTEQATYPHIVADKNSADFFISFLSFDDSQQNNHIKLQVIGYVDNDGSFWEQPLEVADLGELVFNGVQAFYNRPLHSVVLPYETSTELLISVLYFDSSSDVDVRLYKVQFPSNVTYTFRNIVVDEDAGGQLKLTNNSTASEETFVSGTSRSLNTNHNYNIETLPRRYDDYNYNGAVDDYQHHDWNDEYDRYKLSDNFDPAFWEDSREAYYKSLSTVNLNSQGQIEFHDPWYYDEATQTQPDDFRPISPGQYQVFLDQDGSEGGPTYSLRAPDTYTADGITWYFEDWSGRKKQP